MWAVGLLILLVNHEIGTLGGFIGEVVASLVFRVTSVPSHPLKRYIMARNRIEEAGPEIGV